MKKTGLSMLLQLLCVLLLFAVLTGCGASNSNSAATVGNGSLAAKLVWGGADKSAAKSVASIPAGVTKVRLTVSGAGVPVVRNEFAVTPSTTGGQVSGIYPGSVSLVAQALDINDVVVFEGFALKVVVTGGATTDAGTIYMTAPLVKLADKQCLGCHETTIDVTGQNLVADFKQSGHYTNLGFTDANGVGTGCAGCHGPAHNIPSPYSTGRCFECHADKVAMHTNGLTGSGVHAAEFVPTNYAGQCNACHEPHNTKAAQAERVAWAGSAHGDVNGGAWATEDMQLPGQVACQRCHTATGFKAFVATNFQTVSTESISQPGDTGREVLACDGCHTDNSYTVRTVGAFTAKYNNGASPKAFPSVGNSNLCISCHSARESGDTILGKTGFGNLGFVNSHYMGAAATMYMANAFINFTSVNAKVPTNNEGSALKFGAPNYARTMLPNSNTIVSASNHSVTPGIAFGVYSGTTSTHRKLGTPAIAGAETYLPLGGSAITSNGPCVTCHMQADNPVAGDTAQNAGIPVPAVRNAHGHSLLIDKDTAQQLCLPCHADAPHLNGGTGTGSALYTSIATLEQLRSTMLEPQSECFQNGLGLLKQILLTKYMIKYDETAYPYFYDMKLDATGKTAIKDWTRASVAGVTDAAVIALGPTFSAIPAGGFNQAQAMKVMGACFNLNLLVRDPGAYVHARTFTQRLVYDALDYLDNNTMDFSALASSRSLNPTVFKGTNVNVFASNGTLASESMAWMAGTHYTDAQSASATKGTDLKPLKLRP